MEADFRTDNVGPPENVHLNVRPARFHARSSSPRAVDPENRTRSAGGDEKDRVSEEARADIAHDEDAFEREHATDVQFSRMASPSPA